MSHFCNISISLATWKIHMTVKCHKLNLIQRKHINCYATAVKFLTLPSTGHVHVDLINQIFPLSDTTKNLLTL